MREDYLWDRSGEPDPEIQRLEEALGRLGIKEPVEWHGLPKVRHMAPRANWRAAIAAGVALIICASWLASRPVHSGWRVARVEGTPFVGSNAIRNTGHLAVGEALVTDATSRATIDVSDVGEIELEPNSRLRVVRARKTDHRLALDRGTLHATIWAPPRLFSVETPAAVAVDLGCAYTLTVDGTGATILHVTLGWVGFKQDGRESWVPAGAECVTRAGKASGTPYFVDASQAFRDSLAKFDFEGDVPALSTVLAAARPTTR